MKTPSSAILVATSYDGHWPFTADDLRKIWEAEGPVQFVRAENPRLGMLTDQTSVERLVLLGVPATADELASLPNLRAVTRPPGADQAWDEAMKARKVAVVGPRGEGFWGQSVAEFALGLTIAALRRIPQTHQGVKNADGAVWDYAPADGVGLPGKRGHQFGDDSRFVNGTVAGKRVRVAGMGNIGSRFASFTAMLGADVAGWDPVAPDPSFHRAGARRIGTIERLVADAEIFAPMMPLLPATRGIVTADHIAQLAPGSLVVLVTRAEICDVPALRKRVLAGELALAADVFDVEPLPADDPLLQCPHVVLTPHNAGRTRDANRMLALSYAEAFLC